MSSTRSPYSAPLDGWIRALSRPDAGSLGPQLTRFYGAGEVRTWAARYVEALGAYAGAYGRDSEVVVARCPGQMNLMGMHIDYGGMPSLRLAVQGADTLTVAGGPAGRERGTRVRLQSVLHVPGETARFDPVEFDLAALLPAENVGTRQALMDYAGRVCAEREARTGSVFDRTWGIMPQGQLVFLESYFRGRTPIRGFDALVWSNVSPSGGISSSSALVISTAFAALGLHGLRPYVDIPEEDLVDGIGTSEWIRGTRGGTADHGGMILGRSGKLVSVGVFPAGNRGSAAVPDQYVALILDSGVPRVYDDAIKEETVIAYPLGTFLVRDLLLPTLARTGGWEALRPDFAECLRFIRDITADNLGLGVHHLCQLLRQVPVRTCLRQLEERAREAGAGEAWAAMHRRDVGQKFPNIGPEYPILLRRRFAFGLAEQDRVRAAVEYLQAGDMPTVFELARLSHAGDRDQEVADEDLDALEERARSGDPRGQLCFLPGGYGRMTPGYDRAAGMVNAFLQERGGPAAGAVQRLGAGWGGNIGGLVLADFVSGRWRADFEAFLRDEVGIRPDLDRGVAVPGEGACLLEPGS
ncbi:MAG: galactokinase family protein [Gemmatimonadota bacterium]